MSAMLRHSLPLLAVAVLGVGTACSSPRTGDDASRPAEAPGPPDAATELAGAGGARTGDSLAPSLEAGSSVGPAVPGAPAIAAPTDSATAARTPNELGRIPVLEYHLIGGTDAMWQRSVARFREDLALLHARGYRPVTLSQLLDRDLDLPAGLSPVVFTFDDASPSQFRWIERDGRRVVDDTSAIGLWRAFQRTHPDWPSRATFCLLSGAEAGRSFFGNKGIEGQQTEWRFEKVRELASEGFELCNHTLWHANLSKYPGNVVQEQIARGVLAIDSAVPGYRVRTFALPLGEWPKDRALAQRGAWTDPKSGRTVRYDFDAILLVAGGPSRSPHDPAFDPLRIPRVIVTGEALVQTLDQLERSGTRYVSDGDPRTVASPPVAAQRGAGRAGEGGTRGLRDTTSTRAGARTAGR